MRCICLHSCECVVSKAMSKPINVKKKKPATKKVFDPLAEPVSSLLNLIHFL